ncbi:winged helix-turn-helix transcriptional regulator [Microbacterium ulmi]|uniref:Helix-turn-helix transcriptional regulator n=1 Tax=Microbacterium ulmi TaxID=179095 RepID=A0A7Y2M297_9MICO|nr:helix-turn-helix domain-containing protein [Microbacterium ulmi]NII70528.1 DNA-binding HxlR family transcriptional regulator [Microbacterium ulmi]NNH05206.1 helix-turn-helix transcriptional regulator [Microbacterium ulmi]
MSIVDTTQAPETARHEPSILDEAACRGFQHAIDLIGRRWSGAIMLAISRGAERFGEILHLVDGLSDRLLSQRLKELEAQGLVVRTIVPTRPAHARYTLSDRGVGLMAAMQPLVRWGVHEDRR